MNNHCSKYIRRWMDLFDAKCYCLCELTVRCHGYRGGCRAHTGGVGRSGAGQEDKGGSGGGRGEDGRGG